MFRVALFLSSSPSVSARNRRGGGRMRKCCSCDSDFARRGRAKDAGARATGLRELKLLGDAASRSRLPSEYTLARSLALSAFSETFQRKAPHRQVVPDAWASKTSVESH